MDNAITVYVEPAEIAEIITPEPQDISDAELTDMLLFQGKYDWDRPEWQDVDVEVVS